MCSLPTMKFNPVSGADGFASAVFSRGGPLSFSLRIYNVRIMKNCPVELAISFKTFRAAPGAALNVISTTLRSINFGVGVPLGFTAVTPIRPRADVGVGVGVADALRSSDNG